MGRLGFETGPEARTSALELAEQIDAERPEEARAIRVAVGRLSSADEIRRRTQERERIAGRSPTAAEIAGRKAAVRATWADEEGVLLGPRGDDGRRLAAEEEDERVTG